MLHYKKIKEAQVQFIITLYSLQGPGVNSKIEKAQELFGKAKGVADKLGGIAGSVDVNALSNLSLNLQSGSKGRFCD